MRTKASTFGFIFVTSLVFATSYVVTLPQKLSYSRVIAHVKIDDAALPSDPDDPGSPTLIRAEVIELFKGQVQKGVSFSAHAIAHLAPALLPQLKGKEFIIFLHDPRKNGKLWLFEGPRGMRPLSDNYNEWRFDADTDKKVATDSYSHEEYIAILRAWENHDNE